MSIAAEFVRLLRLDVPQDTIVPTESRETILPPERKTMRHWALADRGQVVGSSRHVEAEPHDFGAAVRVLVRLYKRCEQNGNANLARRAQAALRALIGPQSDLVDGDEMVASESTLKGVGP